MIKIPKNLAERLKSPKTLVILGICGILLIFISSFFGGKDKVSGDISQLDVEQYRETLEKNISKMVTDITGSRKVSVIVTLESGVRYSYADVKEETLSDKSEQDSGSSSSEIKETYVTVKTSDGGEQALLITMQMPEIRGVAVVCEGGDNKVLKEKITNAVTAALNITSKRVYICGRN